MLLSSDMLQNSAKIPEDFKSAKVVLSLNGNSITIDEFL